MENKLGLVEILENLVQINDETWGRYAFSRDILKERIPEVKKLAMIKKAIECGREYAQYVIHEYGSSDISVIAEKLKLKVVLKDEMITGKRILFACYTPPNEITIMTEPVEKAIKLIANNKLTLIEYLQKNIIINTILGHEIFHYIEEVFYDKIYTRTEKILLWNFFGFKNLSTICALSEIGAMAFTKELNGLKYSPFILDIFLYYGYDSLNGEKIYQEVLEMSLE